MPKVEKPTKKKPAPKKTAISATKTMKSSTRKRPVPAPVRPRGLKRLNYRRWRRDRKAHIAEQVRLPNVWRITTQAARLLWQHKKLFIGIVVIYGLLNIILVKGLAGSTDVSGLKSELSQIFTGHWGGVASSLTIFVVLIGSTGSGSTGAASAYQVFLLLLMSLAVIWALRQVLTGARPRIRDSYYRGIYPLVPFLLVLLVIAIQLIPLVLGSALYSQVLTNNIAVYFIEQLIWLCLFLVLALWSLYMVVASLFALYIVTLPDMTPMNALRSARELVHYRRWTVLLKVLFLPVLLLVVGMIIVLPIIAIAAPLAQWVFFILSMCSLAAVHAYMYTLYRELLRQKQTEAVSE